MNSHFSAQMGGQQNGNRENFDNVQRPNEPYFDLNDEQPMNQWSDEDFETLFNNTNDQFIDPQWLVTTTQHPSQPQEVVTYGETQEHREHEEHQELVAKCLWAGERNDAWRGLYSSVTHPHTCLPRELLEVRPTYEGKFADNRAQVPQWSLAELRVAASNIVFENRVFCDQAVQLNAAKSAGDFVMFESVMSQQLHHNGEVEISYQRAPQQMQPRTQATFTPQQTVENTFPPDSPTQNGWVPQQMPQQTPAVDGMLPQNVFDLTDDVDEPMTVAASPPIDLTSSSEMSPAPAVRLAPRTVQKRRDYWWLTVDNRSVAKGLGHFSTPQEEVEYDNKRAERELKRQASSNKEVEEAQRPTKKRKVAAMKTNRVDDKEEGEKGPEDGAEATVEPSKRRRVRSSATKKRLRQERELAAAQAQEDAEAELAAAEAQARKKAEDELFAAQMMAELMEDEDEEVAVAEPAVAPESLPAPRGIKVPLQRKMGPGDYYTQDAALAIDSGGDDDDDDDDASSLFDDNETGESPLDLFEDVDTDAQEDVSASDSSSNPINDTSVESGTAGTPTPYTSPEEAEVGSDADGEYEMEEDEDAAVESTCEAKEIEEDESVRKTKEQIRSLETEVVRIESLLTAQSNLILRRKLQGRIEPLKAELAAAKLML